MNKALDYKTILALAVFVAVLGVLGVLWQQPWKVEANISPGEALLSTTTPTVADATNLCPQGNNAASSTTGTLGSVHITGYGAGELFIYDATTTNNNLRVSAATSSLLLAHYPYSGTTTNAFNSSFTRGLLVDYTTGVGTSTITYRCGS